MPTTVLSDADRAAMLLALTPDVGPILRTRLLECFGDAASVLSASEADLQRVQGVGPKVSRRIIHARHEVQLEAQLALVEEHGLSVLLPSRADYPRMLAEIHDPPGVLFVRGAIEPGDAIAVGIVGTRRATHYGKQTAERLAAGLARTGVTIVSGLARGIDAAAHRGALAAGGRTIAVLASGVLNVFPPEHEKLALEVAAHGAVVSEAAPTMPPLAGMFPQRNRIISGLSMGVVVIEAADRSGALITARHAMEQGREVFAVPGPIDSPGSSGPHRLLRDGAKLVTCVDDVLEELGRLPAAAPDTRGGSLRAAAELKLNDLEHAVLQAIQPSGSSLDDVAAASALPIHRVLATVSVLEARRLVRKVGGNRVVRI
ncbi:MAG TPA: DNA-processing protein DprA [Lacipirellulaceae bacterium]|nr:DNA-processing protein DprA [Lacipirellulaceae bacterium]